MSVRQAPVITLQYQAEEIQRLRDMLGAILVGQYMGAGHIWMLDDDKQPQQIEFPPDANIEEILRQIDEWR